MIDKLLPPGDYAIRLLVVGGDDIEGSVMFARWGMPASPTDLGRSAERGIEVLVPKVLEFITAGSWLVVGLDYRPGSFQGSVQADQHLVREGIHRADFRGQLLRIVPIMVEQMARRMIEHVGIDPINYHEPAERPAHLN